MTGSAEYRQKRNAQTRARRQRAREAIQGDEDWHGTTGGYTNHQCRCTSCGAAYKAYNDEWRIRPDVAERRRANQRRTSKTPHRMATVRARTYGLTRQKLADLLAPRQCSACGTNDPGYHGWAVDHDHACCSGKTSCGECVRGILCRRCNMALGAADDDIARLTSLIAYLEKWGARASK